MPALFGPDTPEPRVAVTWEGPGEPIVLTVYGPDGEVVVLLAAAGAAKVLGARHSATRAFAKASTTMAKIDLWHARLALKTLRLDRLQAIAEAAES